MKPNFIFIGPDKSGSTWLWKMLGQHPEIYLARCKDIYYFDRYYSRGMKWYESHFRGAERYGAVGEFSHDYLKSREACMRIKADLPDIRLVTILRDPVDRAFSEFLFLRKQGMVSEKTTFREAVNVFPSIIEGGMYGKFLGIYIAEFGKDHLFVGDYADIVNQPGDLLQSLCIFLGVNPRFRFENFQQVVLPSGGARVGSIAKFVKYVAVKCRDAGLENLVAAVKQSKVVHAVLYKKYNSDDKPVLSSVDRDWLRTIYSRDIGELEQLLSRPFGTWLRVLG